VVVVDATTVVLDGVLVEVLVGTDVVGGAVIGAAVVAGGSDVVVVRIGTRESGDAASFPHAAITVVPAIATDTTSTATRSARVLMVRSLPCRNAYISALVCRDPVSG
jgi:hypothetical protein